MTYAISKRRPKYSSLFDDFFHNDLFNLGSADLTKRVTSPAVNIRETEKEFLLEVAVPGMKKDDFKIELEKTQLTISAEVEDKVKETELKYSRKEFTMASFSRSFVLPKDKVVEDKINASYEDGILHLRIPKMEKKAIVAKKKLIAVS